MTDKKRNALYWVFKVASIGISCLFPIWAACEKFPIWVDTHGASRTVGTGGIIILTVLLIVFRKTVFQFIQDRLNLKHAPPITIWLVLLIVAYVLLYIVKFIADLTLILWMGLFGCGIGNLLTFIAEHFFGKEEDDGSGA